ncbi:hypothetical protein Lumi_039 [Xylophilus phage Lumi]|nr:hypothetical protein Lumi_039 [Xylophilus phage Lumi]
MEQLYQVSMREAEAALSNALHDHRDIRVVTKPKFEYAIVKER